MRRKLGGSGELIGQRISDEGVSLTSDENQRTLAARAQWQQRYIAAAVLLSLAVGAVMFAVYALMGSSGQPSHVDASVDATSVAGALSFDAKTGRSSLLAWRGPDFTLQHRGRGVLRGHTLRATAVDATTAAVVEDAAASAAGEPCTTLVVPAGGSLQVSIATGGHWYGGPSMSRAFWPASLNSIVRQPWSSNDMLADREALGSVLEATWLTSTGASLRVLGGSGGFDFSFNRGGCSARDSAEVPATAEGDLCVAPSAEVPVRVQMCVHADVKDAATHLLSRLPRPTAPQAPSLELLRAPVRTFD